MPLKRRAARLASCLFIPTMWTRVTDSSVLIETTCAWKTRVKLPFETNKQKYLVAFTCDKNKFQNSSSVLIHNYQSVISFLLTEKTTSNEYLSIDSKKRFNGKTVLLRKQHYLIETCIHKLKNFCANINGFDLILFSWTACNANDIDRNWPGEQHHGRKPPHNRKRVFCTKNNRSCPRNHQVVKTNFIRNFK